MLGSSGNSLPGAGRRSASCARGIPQSPTQRQTDRQTDRGERKSEDPGHLHLTAAAAELVNWGERESPVVDSGGERPCFNDLGDLTHGRYLGLNGARGTEIRISTPGELIYLGQYEVQSVSPC